MLKYARLVKIEHTLFSLPMVYAGAFLAKGFSVTLKEYLLIFLAAAGARSTAFALNRIIDARIDALNPRTATRELPAGRIKVAEAWGFALVSALVYIVAAAMLNPWCLILSPIPLAIFVVYPYMKRFTPLAHFGLGAASACAPLGGWMAVSGTFAGCEPSILLGLFSFFWVSGFDIIYAVGDEEFDRQQNLHSLVVSLGKAKALLVSSILHVFGFSSLAILMVWQFPNLWSGAMLAAVGLLLVWQHRVAENVELAFFKINAAVGFVVLGVVAFGRGGF
ncbi:MAG: putative 4-hydroxybenzoate polyprenyltransferase [candidate division Zixibacteria bacterium]|nr:putative 4-hydroxybenzoate polyprenyltransferase [candidate division Zixibacteria bacterium]